MYSNSMLFVLEAGCKTNSTVLVFVPSQATVAPCFRVEGVPFRLLDLHRRHFLLALYGLCLISFSNVKLFWKKVNIISRCKTTLSNFSVLLRIAKA